MQSGADVTMFNRAGHDAVFEAEINDKKEVVDWLLGAVEELENGIGQTGETSPGEPDDEDMDKKDVKHDLNGNTSHQDSTAPGSTVEDVRKQMEGM